MCVCVECVSVWCVCVWCVCMRARVWRERERVWVCACVRACVEYHSGLSRPAWNLPGVVQNCRTLGVRRGLEPAGSGCVVAVLTDRAREAESDEQAIHRLLVPSSTSPYVWLVAAGRGLRVAMATPAIGRRRTASCLRTAVFLFLVTFVWLQLHVATLGGSRQTSGADGPDGNDSAAAILSMVPQVRPHHSCSSYCSAVGHPAVSTSLP